MTKDTAEALMTIYARLGTLLNEATEVIGAEPDAAEQKALRKPVGAAMASLWTELQLPLVTAYPELHPDKPAS
jgi:hypothetical protein